MDENLRKNLTATDTWVRGLFMVLFLIAYGAAKAVLYLIVFFQFFHTLLTGKPNNPLLDFSENLCAYLYEILLYISFNSNDLPFPFATWPNERGGYEAEQVIVTDAEESEPAEGTDDMDDEQPEKEDVPPEETDEESKPKDQDKP